MVVPWHCLEIPSKIFRMPAEQSIDVLSHLIPVSQLKIHISSVSHHLHFRYYTIIGEKNWKPRTLDVSLENTNFYPERQTAARTVQYIGYTAGNTAAILEG